MTGVFGRTGGRLRGGRVISQGEDDWFEDVIGQHADRENHLHRVSDREVLQTVKLLTFAKETKMLSAVVLYGKQETICDHSQSESAVSSLQTCLSSCSITESVMGTGAG